MLRCIFLISAFLIILLPPSYAAEINQAGASRLQSQLSQLLESHKLKLENAGSTLETQGEVTVEQADDYYAATLPEIKLTDDDGTQTKIGLIAVNAIPTENPNDWKISLSIPSPIIYTDKDNQPVMRFDIGEQRMGGLWNGESDSFSKMSGQYKDIKMNHFKRQEILSIPDISAARTPEQTQIKIQNLSITKATGEKILSLGQMHLDLLMKTIDDPEQNKSLLFGLDIKDIVADASNTLPQDLRPTHFKINIELKNFPLDDILGLSNGLIPSLTKDEAGARQVAALQAMLTLPQTLSQAGTTLEISNTAYGNNLYNVDISGNVQASETSIVGARGDITFKITGLNALLTSLEKNPDQQKNLKQLQLIQKTCPKENEQNICRLSLNEKGKFLVNGQDINALRNADTTEAPAPAPAPAPESE